MSLFLLMNETHISSNGTTKTTYCSVNASVK